MNSKRFLGPLDAADDGDLQQHFISPDELDAILTPQCHVIYGGKGIGKTALRRALTELHRADFFTAGTVDLNKLNFQRVYQELEKLEHATGEDTVALARATWRNVIAMYFLELAAQEGAPDDFVTNVEKLLSDEYFSARNAPTRILNQVERFFERLGTIALEDEPASAPRSITETIRSTVADYPRGEEFRRTLLRACAIVAESGKKAVICVDGFDSVVDHLPESRKAIFAGLIDSVYQFANDAEMSRALCVKAFLPKELTHEARAINWDADKFLYNTRYLYWDEESLKEFIQKRLTPHLRSKKGDFDGVWQEFMPKEVRNLVHGIDESSFAYILRHTQFRPRQLLFHVQTILDNWDKKSTAFRVDASFLPSTVATSNKKLAELAVAQLEYARPGITTFIRSFGGSTNTIRFADCYSKISRMFECKTPLECRRVFDELFDFGVLGIAKSSGATDGGSTIKVRFGYAGEGVTAPYAADDDIVALCPMFHDYSGCTRSEFGAVIPSSV